MDAGHLAPHFIEARLQAAHACHVCGDNDGQQAMLAGAANWPAQPGEQALILAAMLSTQGGFEAAMSTLDRALLPVGSARGIMRLRITAQRVALCERSNQLDRARRELQQLPLDTLDRLPAEARDVRVEGWSAHATLAMRNADHLAAATLYRREIGSTPV